MQILLQALVAETGEGKRPTNQIDPETGEQILFAEVFDLAGENGEETLEDTVIELSFQTVQPVPNATVKNGDILLPESFEPEAAPPPPVIDAVPVTSNAQLESDAGLVLPSSVTAKPIEVDQVVTPAQPIAGKEARDPSTSSAPETAKALGPVEDVRVIDKSTLAPADQTERAVNTPLQATKPEGDVVPRAIAPAPVEEAVELAPKSTPTNDIDKQPLRDQPLNAARAQPVEVSFQPPPKGREFADLNPRPFDVLDVKPTQSTQTTTLASIGQAVAAAPSVQPLVQVGKNTARDGILSADHIVAVAPADGDDARLATTNPSRSEPAARPVINQVVHMAFRAAVDGTVEVRLQPEELGRVRIAMTQVETGIFIQVSAERPETLDLLRRNIDLLERDLHQQGFENASFSFSEGSRHAQQHDEDDVPSFSDTPKTNTHIQADVLPESAALDDGRVDIRL